MHVHVSGPEGEAKFWLEPKPALAYQYRLTEKQIAEIQEVLKERKDEITEAWRKHFRS
jgi:hypothetical protein